MPLIADKDVLASAIQSPFPRLRELLEGIEPGGPVVDLTIGEPRHPMPSFLREELARANAGFAKYPPIQGNDALRQSLFAWLARRYGISPDDGFDFDLLPLNGSREGLFSAIFPAIDRRAFKRQPAVLLPNPFYQAYLAAALAGGAEPVMLDAFASKAFLPDLDALEANTDLLNRTAAMFLCSPSNPQGAVAGIAYLERAIALARRHDFILIADECYSEIYSAKKPPGALEVALQNTGSAANVIALNSLSKRSNLPGFRSGFAAGCPAFMKRFTQFRNVAAPQLALPLQTVSAAIWADEAHVEESRRLYCEKFDAADAILGDALGYRRPGGGFFLWLDMAQFGGGEAATLALWQRYGVKVLPGAFLTFGAGQAEDPGSRYIRVALVQDLATTQGALKHIVAL